jgi:hypothetical protein
MELTLLRMSEPRLQAAMSGALLLAALIDFLKLADSVLHLKLSLPRRPPAAPALVGAGLVMGSGGVMMGPCRVFGAQSPCANSAALAPLNVGDVAALTLH